IMSRLPRDIVTLDFDNTDIRDVIHLLAAKAKINIVFGPDVAGSLTLHLADVPFNEAFRTALSMMKLTTDQVGDNILRVITPAELKNQRTTSTAITKVYVLNYAKAAEVKATIDSVRTAEGRSGSSTADTKTNTLIVTDSMEGQLSTENLISQMDQRPRQVLIETKIVEINANSGLNYGVQWDYQGVQNGRIGGQQGTSLIGTTANPMAASSPILAPLDRNANTVVGAGASGRGTGVALAADRVFGALTLGRITNNFILNATLTAAASEGKAKILSEPKIATLNNQAANINVTTQIPYVTSNVASTGVQTQTVAYVTTGIKLTVTPSINADGRITLQVNPDVSQPSTTAAGSTQTGAPAVDSRNATTTVLVRDGETIVIGGLITDTLQDTIAKIPLLGDIPILGWLFKKKTKTRVRAELLIFVTTRILPD
ncbi:MAG: type IV pilus secretin PilQ, partial [Elusimicrobiota bacterium]